MTGQFWESAITLFRQTLFVGLAVLIALPPNAAHGAQPVGPRQITAKEYVVLVRDLKFDDKKVQATLNDIFAKRVVVFIPGILGSRLSALDGTPIWGHKSKASVTTLALKSATSPATASVLDSYPLLGISRQDIYGEFDRLEVIATGGDFERREFAYDWRQDIEFLADQLEERFRGEWATPLKGKTLVVVAHSTGGVIAWHWKNKYLRNGKYDFNVGKFVLVGVPMQGSCEMLRMLLTGYRPIPGAGSLEDKMYRYLFSDLKPAAYTFQSVFQLLPSDETSDLKQRCLMAEEESGIYDQNHFSIATWKKLLLPFLQAGRPMWERLGETEDVFMQRLDRFLARAKDFRKNIDLSEAPLDNRVEYFYSGQHPTTSQVFVAAGDVDSSRGILKDGDGRVMGNSAKNSGKFRNTPRGLLANHGDLVKDPLFIRFMSDELKQDWGRTSRELALAIADSRQAQELFSTNGLLLSLSDLGFSPALIAARQNEPDQSGRQLQAVLKLNEATLTALNSRPENKEYADSNPYVFAYRYARHLDDNKKNKAAAVPLYETALASGTLKNTPNEAYALNRYGYAQYSLGRMRQANWPIALANSIVRQSKGVYTEEFRSTVARNIVATQKDEFLDIDTLLVGDSWKQEAWSVKGKVAKDFKDERM